MRAAGVTVSFSAASPARLSIRSLSRPLLTLHNTDISILTFHFLRSTSNSDPLLLSYRWTRARAASIEILTTAGW